MRMKIERLSSPLGRLTLSILASLLCIHDGVADVAERPGSASLMAGPAIAGRTPVHRDYGPLQAIYDQITSDSWTPEARFVAIGGKFEPGFFSGFSVPKDCKQGVEQRVAIEYSNLVPTAKKPVPLRYRGQSLGCYPKGAGVIDYSDGSLWIGEIDSSGGQGRPEVLPIRAGLGITHLRAGEIHPWVIHRYKAQPSGLPGLSADKLVEVISRQEKASSFFTTGGDERGSGTVSFHYPDGRTLIQTVSAGQPETGKLGSLNMAETFYAEGTVASVTDAQVLFKPAGLNIRLATIPGHPLPRGLYTYYPFDARAKILSKTSALVEPQAGLVDPVLLLRPERRRDLMPLAYEDKAILSRQSDETWGCLQPEPIPPGWIVWWPGCLPPGEDGVAATPVYAADGEQRVLWWNSDQYRHEFLDYSRETQLSADRFTLSPNLQPSGPAEVIVRTALGWTYFYGDELSGTLPEGNGYCSQKRVHYADYHFNLASLGLEPCEFQQGKRVDEIFQAQLEVNALRAQALAAEREAQSVQMQASQERAAREADEQARQYARERAQQRAEQRASEEEGRQAILAAIGDVQQKFAQAAVEMEESRENNRSVMARYEAEQSRGRAQKARATEAAASRRQQEASQSAAVIQSRTREAEARVAAARQAAAQRVAARSAANTAGVSAGAESTQQLSSTTTDLTQNKAAGSPVVIISAQGRKTGCGAGFNYRESYTVTSATTATVSQERQRLRAEIEANGAFAWIDSVPPGGSYAIATIRKKAGQCAWNSVRWAVDSGGGAEARLLREIKQESYVDSYSVVESKYLPAVGN